MGLITKPNTFVTGNKIVAAEHNSNFDTMYNEFNGNITDANIANNAGIKASKIDFTDIEKVSKTISQVAHTLAVGDWVRLNGAGSYVIAQADSLANSAVIGLVVNVADADTFTLQASGYTNALAGLTIGTQYYLSPSSAGDMTTTAPTTAGEIVKPVFIAKSATEGWVSVQRGIAVPVTPLRAVGSTDISKGVGAYSDMADMSVTITTTGRPVMMTFNACMTYGNTGEVTLLRFDVDGNPKHVSRYTHADASYSLETPVTLIYMETLAAGSHTIKVQWSGLSGTVYQYGTTYERILIVQEL